MYVILLRAERNDKNLGFPLLYYRLYSTVIQIYVPSPVLIYTPLRGAW